MLGVLYKRFPSRSLLAFPAVETPGSTKTAEVGEPSHPRRRVRSHPLCGSAGGKRGFQGGCRGRNTKCKSRRKKEQQKKTKHKHAEKAANSSALLFLFLACVLLVSYHVFCLTFVENPNKGPDSKSQEKQTDKGYHGIGFK